ncbi:MAG: hypothetical protein COC04_05015, partial [Gammaproteobacteria bacterium]
MKVDMDEEMRAYKFRKTEESKASLSQWLLLIFLGVFLGNTASFGLERAVLYWEIKQVALAATAVMEESTRKIAIQSTEQRKIREEQAKRRQIENQQKQAGLRPLPPSHGRVRGVRGMHEGMPHPEVRNEERHGAL